MNLGRAYLEGRFAGQGRFRGEAWQRAPDVTNLGWRYTIVIGMPEKFSAEMREAEDEDVPALAIAAVAALKEARDYDRSDEVGAELRSLAEEFASATTTEEYNDALEGLYDWGDGWRVIIK